MITRLVMWWIHRQYLKYGESIFYIRGTGKDYPKYLLYTEDPKIYRRYLIADAMSKEEVDDPNSVI